MLLDRGFQILIFECKHKLPSLTLIIKPLFYKKKSRKYLSSPYYTPYFVSVDGAKILPENSARFDQSWNRGLADCGASCRANASRGCQRDPHFTLTEKCALSWANQVCRGPLNNQGVLIKLHYVWQRLWGYSFIIYFQNL